MRNMILSTAITATTVLGVTGLLLQSSAPQKKDSITSSGRIHGRKKETWKCPDCNSNEKYVLEKLQEKTKISDRNALATIMGNIKSESNFHPNICEEKLEFLTTLAIGVGMVLFSGPQ